MILREISRNRYDQLSRSSSSRNHNCCQRREPWLSQALELHATAGRPQLFPPAIIWWAIFFQPMSSSLIYVIQLSRPVFSAVSRLRELRETHPPSRGSRACGQEIHPLLTPALASHRSHWFEKFDACFSQHSPEHGSKNFSLPMPYVPLSLDNGHCSE